MSVTLLAIETCSEACSLALVHDGKVSQLVSYEPRGHAVYGFFGLKNAGIYL